TEILNERKYFCTVGSKSSYRTARDRNRGSLRPMPIALLKYALKSAFKAEHAGDAHFKWTPDLKPTYDVIIIGAGGHGLAAAYYLATKHGITNIAVLEKGY